MHSLGLELNVNNKHTKTHTPTRSWLRIKTVSHASLCPLTWQPPLCLQSNDVMQIHAVTHKRSWKYFNCI